MIFRRPAHIDKDSWNDTLKELKQSGRDEKVTQKQLETLAELLSLKTCAFQAVQEKGMTSINTNGNEGPSGAFTTYCRVIALREKMLATLGKPRKREHIDPLLNL